jgi:hypothetical protein
VHGDLCTRALRQQRAEVVLLKIAYSTLARSLIISYGH